MRIVRESSEIKCGDIILYGSFGEPLIIDYARYQYNGESDGRGPLCVGPYTVESLFSQFEVIKV